MIYILYLTCELSLIEISKMLKCICELYILALPC